MVYNPCPDGWILRGGVCVPLSNEALMRWKSKGRVKGPRQPEPEPEPEPDPEPPVPPVPVPPVPPVPVPPEPEPDPVPPVPPVPVPPVPPEPEPEPEPAVPPEPPIGPDGVMITITETDTSKMSDAEVAALLTSMSITATAGIIRMVRQRAIIPYSASNGETFAVNFNGQGMGAGWDGVDLSTLRNQDEATALLGEDEFGNKVVELQEVDLNEPEETDQLLPDKEKGVEMKCFSGRRLVGGLNVDCADETKDYDEADLDSDELDALIDDAIKDNPELTEEEVMAGLTSGDLDILFAATGEAIAFTGLALYIDKLATDKQTQEDTIQIGKDIGLDPNTPSDIDAVVTTDANNIIKDTTGVNPYEIVPQTEKAIVDAAKETGKFVEDVGKDIGKALNPFNW